MSNVNYNKFFSKFFRKIFLVLDFSGLQLNPEIVAHFYIRRPAYFCQMIVGASELNKKF